MATIKLKNGFECELDDDQFDDMELLDDLAEVLGGNTLKLGSAVSRVFGDDKKRFYDSVRNKAGRVQTRATMEALTEAMTLLKQGKNS